MLICNPNLVLGLCPDPKTHGGTFVKIKSREKIGIFYVMVLGFLLGIFIISTSYG